MKVPIKVGFRALALVFLAAPFTSAIAADVPACGDAPLPPPVTIGSCAGAEIEVAAATPCVSECGTPTIAVHLFVSNTGAAAAPATSVRLYRRDADGDVLVHTEPVEDLAAGAAVTVGPIAVDATVWATGMLEARVDESGAVTECVEGGEALVGPWPDPWFDVDKDGYTDAACGGPDCDDAVSDVHPGGLDVPGDGIDQDCTGADAVVTCDFDGDGHDRSACGGADCDDAQAGVNPGAVEIDGDGIDQNCDGAEFCEREPYMVGGRCATGGTPTAPWAIALLLLARRRRA